MYTPKLFEVDEARAVELIDRYPFATLITIDNSAPVISHVPVLIESAPGAPLRLVGHLARANPQWRTLQSNPRATLLFHGPHTYISPRWYVSGRDVPTWNYAVTHVHGRVRLIEDYENLKSLLQKLSDRFESGASKPWEFYLPKDLEGANVLPRMIVGFEIEVERIEAKFKLSQNRVMEDQLSVVRQLSDCPDDQSREMAAMMRAGLGLPLTNGPGDDAQ